MDTSLVTCTYHMTLHDVCKFIGVFLDFLTMYSFFLFIFYDCYIPHQYKLKLYLNWSQVLYELLYCSLDAMLAGPLF